jgi:hypothetical protein
VTAEPPGVAVAGVRYVIEIDGAVAEEAAPKEEKLAPP